jgi:vacuolar-type H+-ATPase subunit I/STV1
MWFVKAWKWIKEHAFAVGAAIGAACVAIIAFILSGGGLAKKLIELKRESNEDQAKVAAEKIERVKEFISVTDQIRNENERLGQELTKEEEENLEERKELYANANSKEEMDAIIADIQEAHPNLNFVPLSSLAIVEEKE